MLEAETDRFDAVMARLRERYPLANNYTTEDLAKIPPCPICGVRARIENGRLYQPCIRAKHFPKLEPVPTPSPLPVQRSFDDEKEEWWHR